MKKSRLFRLAFNGLSLLFFFFFLCSPFFFSLFSATSHPEQDYSDASFQDLLDLATIVVAKEEAEKEAGPRTEKKPFFWLDTFVESLKGHEERTKELDTFLEKQHQEEGREDQDMNTNEQETEEESHSETESDDEFMVEYCLLGNNVRFAEEWQKALGQQDPPSLPRTDDVVLPPRNFILTLKFVTGKFLVKTIQFIYPQTCPTVPLLIAVKSPSMACCFVVVAVREKQHNNSKGGL